MANDLCRSPTQQHRGAPPRLLASMIGMKQISLGVVGRGQSLLSHGAEAEARRRVLITATAVERYRGQLGSYPQTLQALVPELLRHPPVDFIDGQPLRYRLTEDGHFVLYSVGMDCVDDGGEVRQPRRRGLDYPGPPDFSPPARTDLVWPRPALAAGVQAQQQEKKRQAEQAKAAAEERWAEMQR